MKMRVMVLLGGSEARHFLGNIGRENDDFIHSGEPYGI